MYAKKMVFLSGVLTLVTSMVVAQEKYGFGTKAHPDEIAKYETDIHLDGTGLPAGSGNAAMGREIYEVQCAVCHGEQMQGVREMGAQSMHEGRRAINKLPYATPLFDFIRRAMPLTDPGTLSTDETYALVAFLLSETGVIDKDTVMNADNLKALKMPNRPNFIIDPASGFTEKELE